MVMLRAFWGRPVTEGDLALGARVLSALSSRQRPVRLCHSTHNNSRVLYSETGTENLYHAENIYVNCLQSSDVSPKIQYTNENY